MMPKVDGWQVCRQLKASLKTKAVPVVMLTACDQKIDQLRGWESGVDEFMAKPWDPAALLELVEKWCGAPKGRSV
jgi:DNA-binding response OmpR family regulator